MGFDEESVREAALAREFTKNFEDRYGKIDPEHNWGFESVVVPSFTRATEVNRNQWDVIQNQYQVQFPGWPFEDQGTGDTYSNKFNAVYTDGSTPSAYANPTYDHSSSVAKYLVNGTEIMPAGDVTDEEIQYVSWYFRTHKDPGKEPLHLTDFFIQEVSSDYDRNQDGTIRAKNASGGDPLTYHMDYIAASKTEEVSSDADHTNNFNNSHSNWLGGNESMYMGSAKITNDPTLHYSQRLCEFFTSSGTEGFQCKSSDDSSINNDWNLVHLVFDIDGHHYDGYYLGFDYSFHKTTSTLERDHYYSNWIVKISPAKPLPQYTRRIMCEDLGNTLDFDFNDIVFDVTYSNSSSVLITVQASGGTLPIYIGELDEAYEAHYLLGVDQTSTPVNVNAKGGVDGRTANFRYTTSSSNPDDIPVYVMQPKNSNANASNVIKLQIKKDNNWEKGDQIAPQKFCVPVGVRWMKENKQIEESYTKFSTWVKKMSDAPQWFLNANVQNDGLLYNSGAGLTKTEFNYDHSHGDSN